MATKSIAWTTGTGNITLTYTGQGDGTIAVQSDPNNLYEARSAQIIVRTTDGSNIERTITIQQAANVRIDISTAIVTASTQTYSGSALTPTPTVTLNGETIPSSGYDVAYSNNTNAGTATITVTGKGEYTGTATGTFTIAKANPTYTAPTANSLTYNGNSRYLTTTGSTSDGTIQYSADGTTWSTTRVTKTTAGTYTTYWRLVGDANHNDVESTPITTTINKASRTISFTNTYYVQNTSTTTTRTATPSAGSSDGAITYSISSTTYATINSSSGAVTSKTFDGSATVTATIAEGTNYLSASTSYTLYVFATTHNYSYNGSYRSVTLPPGTYQFQCWGAQGGSNGTNSTYGITAQAGGKGGYSIGQLTVSSATAVRVYVGGQGSASAGGFNGGGSTTGTSQKNANGEFGYSKMGGGGGATDIRLSDGSLYSRMIVAGGGSGGALVYSAITTSTTTSIWPSSASQWEVGTISGYDGSKVATHDRARTVDYIDISNAESISYSLTGYNNNEFTGLEIDYYNSSYGYLGCDGWLTGSGSKTPKSGAKYIMLVLRTSTYDPAGSHACQAATLTMTTSSTSSSTNGCGGYAGGGERSEAADTAWVGHQTGAGDKGSFGQGANQTATTYRYCSGAGGGGWYGGGGARNSNSYDWYSLYSGGGSGWVNTSASSGNRPSGFSSLQLDSGTTYAGNTSFPSTSGGTETGHSGNGYARITRL